MSAELYDVAIVGAGAAGLMTAIQAKRLGLNVLLLDGREKIGAKILMSGGTRCNVTNENVSERDFAGENLRLTAHVLRAWPSRKAVAFFNELGVDLILEPGGKFFPSTHSAATVLNALLSEVKRTGVTLIKGQKISGIEKKTEGFDLLSENQIFRAKTAVLCTGGLSYPATGSDGTGYRISQALGHTLVPTIPALTPLLTGDDQWKSLSGVSTDCRLTLQDGRKKIISFEAPVLFTHFGFSGPAALNLSRHWERIEKKSSVRILISFLPGDNEQKLGEKIRNQCRATVPESVRHFVSDRLPGRLAKVILEKSGIEPAAKLHQISREKRTELIRNLLSCELPVSGVFGYSKAEVTAGGIPLKEVSSKTLESKTVPGLFFAGEILDTDGRIGGFNFQWAWSSGFVAAHGVHRSLAKHR